MSMFSAGMKRSIGKAEEKQEDLNFLYENAHVGFFHKDKYNVQFIYKSYKYIITAFDGVPHVIIIENNIYPPVFKNFIEIQFKNTDGSDFVMRRLSVGDKETFGHVYNSPDDLNTCTGTGTKKHGLQEIKSTAECVIDQIIKLKEEYMRNYK